VKFYLQCNSGLDRALPNTLPQTAYSKSCISESLDTPPWSDCNQCLDTGSRVPGSEEATLVSHGHRYITMM
jgi:hypothetical protein